MSGPSRRDVVLGGALGAAALGAAALVPRDRLVLLADGQRLDDLVPEVVGPWRHVPAAGIVLPRQEGSLSARLYGQVLARGYLAEGHLPMTLVMAYGAVQNDLLQLHRPEVCYSAVGFEISQTLAGSLPLPGGASLPVRRLVARSGNRVETITYWTRVGDDLPTSGTEQRLVKLRQQWHGYIADGLLVRLSTGIAPDEQVTRDQTLFARLLVEAVPAASRAAIVGRPLAARLA